MGKEEWWNLFFQITYMYTHIFFHTAISWCCTSIPYDEGCPMRKISFLLSSYNFFVYGDTTTIIRGAAKKIVHGWYGSGGVAMVVCGKMKCLTLRCLFSIFSIFFFYFYFFIFLHLSYSLSLSLLLYSPFLDDEKCTTNNAGRKKN